MAEIVERLQRCRMLRVLVALGVMGHMGWGEESGVFAFVLVSVARYVADGRRMLRRTIARVHQDGQHWGDGIHRVRERRPNAFSSGPSSACRRGGRGRLRVRFIRRRGVHESPAHASPCFFLPHTATYSARTVVLGGRVVHVVMVCCPASILPAPFSVRVWMGALRRSVQTREVGRIVRVPIRSPGSHGHSRR